jgi:hypothetical protein
MTADLRPLTTRNRSSDNCDTTDFAVDSVRLRGDPGGGIVLRFGETPDVESPLSSIDGRSDVL